MSFFNSRYNFCFKTEDGLVLYNSKTGATVNLEGKDAGELTVLLTGPKMNFESDQFDSDMLQSFVQNGFIVEDYRDELLEVRELYWKSRGVTPIVLTITTTMDCNLGCYYCYESRTKHKLEYADIDLILEGLHETYLGNLKRSLHVDWYGGEPLLNIDFLTKASKRLQQFCVERNINYHASIISNGTVWPEDIGSFIKDNRIRQVQISFDGLKENHNKRRKYRGKRVEDSNSFDTIVTLIDELLDHVHVDLRINIDWKNKYDVDGLLDLFSARGWFNKRYPAVVQPARVSSYSERSSFIEQTQLSLEEFNSIREHVSRKLNGRASIEESEVPDGFPFPKTYVCAALASQSTVIGADKLIYRCGLQVGESHRAVGDLTSERKHFQDIDWWDEFDPTSLPSCSRCSFLPVCFGGCPKKHLENDRRAMDEQSQYWRENLEKKVVGYVKYQKSKVEPLREADQFRNGY